MADAPESSMKNCDMVEFDDYEFWPLNFLKHDWFEKASDQITVHIYVKDVSECRVDFTENITRILFKTSNEQFCKVYGSKSEDAKNKIFSYVIHTSDKIVPSESSYAIRRTCIDLKITKAIPKRWVSLETRNAMTDRKQTADAKPGVITRGATATAKGNSEISNARASLTKQDLNHSFQGERLRRETTAKVQDLNQDLPQEELPKRENKPDMDLKTRNPFAIKHSGSTENIKLLGGKSTPVSKKAGEQENKIEKETVTVAEPQASAVAKESSSLKNVNKTVASRSDLVGLTGLENYANNCYMNVVIQVLANIPEIRDYFAGDNFLNSLTPNNPMSSGGRVAKAFADVIKALWSERKTAFRPQALKSIMGKRCSLFMGFQQCDAQEFFSTLLDNLHEDMNQGVRPEKTNEPTNKEEDGNSFSDKPDTAWNAHFKRNNSMLVKMFHGQMVSKLTCQACHKRSTTFEPCAQVSLPIAMSKHKLNIIVFFKDHTRQPERLRLQISSPHAQIWHLLNILERHVGIPAHCLRIFQDTRGSFAPTYDEDSPIGNFVKSRHVIVCEIKDEKEADAVSLPFRQHVSTSAKASNCAHCSKSQSDLEVKLKRCTRCMYVAYCSRECQTKHWGSHQRDCRKGLKSLIGLPFFVTIRKLKLTYDTLASIAGAYASFSVSTADKESDSSEGEQDEKNRSPKLDIATSAAPKHSDKTSRASVSSEYEQDEKKRLSRSDSTGNSGVRTTDNTPKAKEGDKDDKNRQPKAEGASNIIVKSHDNFVIKAFFKADQDPVLVTSDDFKLETLTSATFLSIEWQTQLAKEKDTKEMLASFRQIQSNMPGDESVGSDRCTIEDCLSLFLEPDRLHEKDGWKCPKCKLVQAVKKEMTLSYPPPILLVHFKRFTFASYGQKIPKGIHYPISGLDLSHYISEETRGLLSIPPVYDLTGVICHKGSMGIGHYTCMVQCLSQQGQTDIGWRHFDDDNVSKIDDDRVIDPSAYVLVYRMRGAVQALKSDSPFPCLQAFANEGKQDKATATSRPPGRQLSVDSGIKASCRASSSENLHTKETTWLSGRRSESVEMMQERPPQLLRAKSISSEDMSDDVFELANDGEISRGSTHDAMDIDLAGSNVKLGEQANFVAETTEDEEMIEAEPIAAQFDHRSMDIDMQPASSGLRSYMALGNPNGTPVSDLNPLAGEDTTTLEEELELKPCKRTKSELEDQGTNDNLFENSENSDERYYLACSDMKLLDLSDVDLTENELD
eukprot:Seg2238.7 transcript_id=Seg2238.7/GoldUCD/mRNA.D3Y31 product="Ubiquitin carboxyl-terminal hydrolase 19" protein_id=Seg2238.7/GoldUCD/D3Y31